MKNNYIKEVVVGGVLVVLAVLLLNPFHFWMPDMMHVVVCVLILAVFALFAIFMLRENAGDERDALHRMLAGRVAFLTGAALLIFGIVFQELQNDTLDVWLVVALVAMVLSKLATRIYCDWRL